MNEKMEKSLAVLIAHSTRHCHRFRLADYDIAAIPNASLRALASSMLDDFERGLESLLQKTGDKSSDDAPSNGTFEGASSHQTVRLRSFPSRQ